MSQQKKSESAISTSSSVPLKEPKNINHFPITQVKTIKIIAASLKSNYSSNYIPTRALSVVPSTLQYQKPSTLPLLNQLQVQQLIQVNNLSPSLQSCFLLWLQSRLLNILDIYHHMHQVWIYIDIQVNNMSGPSKYPSSVSSYVPSVNPSISPSEKQVGDLQEESLTTLEQVKALENIIA